MDEMEKSIRTRSEALGYKFAVLLLATWTLVNLVLYLATGGARDMLPTLVLIAVLLAQGFSCLLYTSEWKSSRLFSIVRRMERSLW